MQVYFEGVERQQQIDIEDLEAEIRRLKRAAQEHEANSNQLRENNALCGEELKSCSEKVVALEIKTKDKDKNRFELQMLDLLLHESLYEKRPFDTSSCKKCTNP